MFKIVENKDGSTTVYCVETGRVICSVPKMRDKPLGDIQPTLANILCETRKNLRKRAIKKKTKGIGRPIPRAIAAPSGHDQKTIASTSTGSKSSDKHIALNNPYPQIVPMICPLPQSEGIYIDRCIFERDIDPYIDAEISTENLVQNDFLLTLGLIPEEKQKNNEWKKLREELPTRFISRTSSKDKFRISSDRKIYEECDIVSPAGLKFLNETREGQKNNLDPTVDDSCIKKYNHYCAMGCAFVNGPTAHYSMRDREAKVYPVTFKSKSHQEYSHMYCFNSPQRLEQKKRIRTGLTKRSRKLKAVCKNRGEISIKLLRLSEKEIKERTRRRPPPPPEIIVLDDDSDIEVEVCHVLKMDNQKKKFVLLNSFSKTSPASRVSARLSKSNLRKPEFSQIYANKASAFKKCYVKVQNVLEQLETKSDGIYVKNTKIKVRQMNLKTQLSHSKPSINSIHSYARLHDKSVSATSQRYDHPYFRPTPSQALVKKKPVLNGMSHRQYTHINGSVLAQKTCNTINLFKPVSLVQSTVNHTHLKFQSSTVKQIVVKSFSLNHPNSRNPIVSCGLPNSPAQTKIIPIVDLASDDETDDSNTMVPTELPQSSKTTETTSTSPAMCFVYCYACKNYQQSFQRKDEAHEAALQHLTGYHSVLQPEKFLETRSGSSNQYEFVEVFPGYKSS